MKRSRQRSARPDHGTRLNPVALAVKFEGRSIGETTAMSVDEALKTMRAIKLKGRDKAIGEDAVKEIISRLEIPCKKVGLGLPQPGSRRTVAFGRRSAAHSFGSSNRQYASGRLLRA